LIPIIGVSGPSLTTTTTTTSTSTTSTSTSTTSTSTSTTSTSTTSTSTSTTTTETPIFGELVIDNILTIASILSITATSYSSFIFPVGAGSLESGTLTAAGPLGTWRIQYTSNTGSSTTFNFEVLKKLASGGSYISQGSVNDTAPTAASRFVNLSVLGVSWNVGDSITIVVSVL
jgi:hypothetical protein